MKSSVEDLSTVQKKLKVDLEEEEVSSVFESEYEKLRRKASVKGFRKGKAPIHILKKFYHDKVSHQVSELLISAHLPTVIEENKLQVVGEPDIKAQKPKQGFAFSFTAVVDLFPIIELEEYKGLSVSIPVLTYYDKLLEDELYLLRRRHAKIKDTEADTLAKNDMLATIDQQSTIDGVPFPHYSASAIPVEIGAGQVLKETEEQLIGMKVGEEKTFTSTLPDDFSKTEYAGKSVDLKVKLIKLQELLLPELDDGFAKDFGKDSIEDLKTEVTDLLKARIKDLKRNELENAILETLLAKHRFEVPPSMIKRSTDQLIEQRFKNLDEKKREEAKKDEKLREELKERATQQSQSSLLLGQIIKKEGISISPSEIDVEMERLLPHLSQEARKEAMKNLTTADTNRLGQNILMTKVFDLLIENANVTEIPD